MIIKRKEIDKLIENAFKVLKKEAYHDNYSEINKVKISKFENDSLYFNKIEKIKNQLYFAQVNIKEINFIDSLINKIDFHPLLKSPNKDGSTSLNFSIDIPVELQIIDCAWSLLFFKYNKNDYNKNYLYANKFDKYIKNKDPLCDDLNKLMLFKRYKHGYNEWLNNANSAFKNKINTNDITLISVDFSRFYYNIDNSLDILKLNTELHNNKLFYLLTFILKKIYIRHTENIKPYLNILKNYNYILPIGLSSSKILSNYLLRELDRDFNSIQNNIFYGRYVDDIIFLFEKEISVEEAIKIINDKISKHPDFISLEIKKTKVKNKFYRKGSSAEKLEIAFGDISPSYNDEFDYSMSYNLLYDLERSFIRDDIALKHLTIDKFYSLNARNFLIIWSFLLNEEIIDTEKINIISERIINEIDYKINGFFIKLAIKFLKKHNSELIEKFYSKLMNNLKEEMDEISPNLEEHKSIPEDKMFDYYTDKIALSFITNEIYNSYEKEEKLIFRNYFKSGFYTLESISNNLINNIYNNRKITYKTPKRYYGNSLQNIHYHDLKIYASFMKLFYPKKTVSYNRDYNELNNIIKKDNLFKFNSKKNKLNGVEYQSNQITINAKINNENFVVSQPNINLNYEYNDSEELFSRPTFDETFKFFRILNEARVNKTNLIVMPEFYVKLNWLYSLAFFSKNEEMDIIFGVQPFIYCGQYVNLLGSFYYQNSYWPRVTIPLFRLKNHYSHDEIAKFSPVMFPIRNTYINIIKKNYSSTSLLCFEATDIFARSLFKGKTDVVAIPMLNRDTTYFNNIIESLSRDLSSIVISSNSFRNGNSVIVQPTKTFRRIITEFKGGFNNYLVSSTIPIMELRAYNQNYNHNEGKFKRHPAGYENK